MVSLPTVGASENSWGGELNDFLDIFLRSTGKPKITWASVSESSGTYSVDAGSNIATGVGALTKNGTGDISIAFTAPISSAVYFVVGTVESSSPRLLTYDSPTVNGFNINIKNASDTAVDDAFSFMVWELVT